MNGLLYAAAAVTVPVGLAASYSMWASQQEHDAASARATERKRPAKVAAVSQKTLVSSVTYERAVDETLFAWLAQSPRAGNDLFGDRSFRVDAVASALGEGIERIDVDLDRDGNLDEQWLVQDGVVRAVSVEDDGVFGPRTVWSRGGWKEVQVQEPGDRRLPDIDPTILIEALVLGFEGKPLANGEKMDLLPTLPVRIDLFQDDGHSVANRAHVDLDRDGRLDQVWEMGEGSVQRRVSPADDGIYTIMERREGKGWISVTAFDEGG